MPYKVGPKLIKIQYRVAPKLKNFFKAQIPQQCHEWASDNFYDTGMENFRIKDHENQPNTEYWFKVKENQNLTYGLQVEDFRIKHYHYQSNTVCAVFKQRRTIFRAVQASHLENHWPTLLRPSDYSWGELKKVDPLKKFNVILVKIT